MHVFKEEGVGGEGGSFALLLSLKYLQQLPPRPSMPSETKSATRPIQRKKQQTQPYWHSLVLRTDPKPYNPDVCMTLYNREKGWGGVAFKQHVVQQRCQPQDCNPPTHVDDGHEVSAAVTPCSSMPGDKKSETCPIQWKHPTNPRIEDLP